MKLHIALMYLGFFGLIGGVCYITTSAWPLLALFFMPSYEEGKGKAGEKIESD